MKGDERASMERLLLATILVPLFAMILLHWLMAGSGEILVD